MKKLKCGNIVAGAYCGTVIEVDDMTWELSRDPFKCPVCGGEMN